VAGRAQICRLPDLEVYRDALAARVMASRSPHSDRSSVRAAHRRAADRGSRGRRVREVRRLGKRIVLALEDELFLVVHLMIAGRLSWLDQAAKAPARITLARLEFPRGTRSR
jgi:formamidopyrimidine-DNA glycosylase